MPACCVAFVAALLTYVREYAPLLAPWRFASWTFLSVNYEKGIFYFKTGIIMIEKAIKKNHRVSSSQRVKTLAKLPANQLYKKANTMRKDLVKIAVQNQAGQIAPSLSCVDILP